MLDWLVQLLYDILTKLFQKDLVVCACNFKDDIYINLSVIHSKLSKKISNTKIIYRNRNFVIDTVTTIYYLSRSKVVILDCSHWLISKINISPKTILIFVGHGGGCYKKMGFSRTRIGLDHKKNFKLYGQYRYVISTSSSFDEKIRQNYSVPNGKKMEILPIGLPRTDLILLAQRDHATEKIILFAPSYIEERKKRFYKWDFNRIDEIAKKLGLIIWFCHHPDVHAEVTIPNSWVDCSAESYSQKILTPSLLLTDRSSIMFDFSITEKPILLLDNQASSDLWMPKEELHGVNLCQSYEDLEKKLINTSNLVNSKALREQHMNRCNGHSTDELILKIKGLIK